MISIRRYLSHGTMSVNRLNRVAIEHQFTVIFRFIFGSTGRGNTTKCPSTSSPISTCEVEVNLSDSSSPTPARNMKISASKLPNGPNSSQVSPSQSSTSGIRHHFQNNSRLSIPSATEMPFKQAPILEVDGTVLTQSHSIARYLARTFKIAGKNDLEQAQTDEYVDLVYDLIGGKWSVVLSVDVCH